jgi:adenine specific DNA methylase Mod
MESWRNTIFVGDCLQAVKGLAKEHAGRFKLIYLDPPFFTDTDYSIKTKTGNSEKRAPLLSERSTYTDKWEGGLKQYLAFLEERLAAMKCLVSDDGSIWLHLDWHVSHYAKVLMDELFGYDNFVNEIVWRRTNSPKAQSKGFGTQHDMILLYAKDSSLFRARPVYRQHDSKSVTPYRYKDEKGRFRLIEIEAQGIQRSEDRKQFEWRGRTAPYLYKKETLDEWWSRDLIYRSKNGRYSKKQYLDDVPGVVVSDLWLDIPPLQGSSPEYTGFITQKPESLLKRIIESASERGDLVADFFAGTGTTAVAAERAGRKWAICDSSETAIDIASKRLSDLGSDFRVIRSEAETREAFLRAS